MTVVHPTKNKNLQPSQVSNSSHKKVWWRCSIDNSHEWEARVANRTFGKRGCPYCSGLKVHTTTSLSARFSILAQQWHATKNSDLSPDEVTYGSNKRVWWQCPVNPDHEWEATVNSRTSRNKRSCPFCSGKRPTVAASLASQAAHIAEQWHPTKNGDFTPAQVFATSTRKVWWQCERNEKHVWIDSVLNRTKKSKPKGCPQCDPYCLRETSGGRDLSPRTSTRAVSTDPFSPDSDVSSQPSDSTSSSRSSSGSRDPTSEPRTSKRSGSTDATNEQPPKKRRRASPVKS